LRECLVPPGLSVLIWILHAGRGEAGDMSDILSGSTIEASSLPIIYEDVFVDFAFDIFTTINMKCTVFWIVTP
jgi:hypothetical protein